MAHTLEALKNSTIQGVVTVPDDGDAQGAASVNGPFLALENARAALYPLALGLSSGEGWIRADPGGSNVSPKVLIGRVCGVLLDGEVCEVGGTRELLLSDVDGSPANLANNTWYYVVLRKPVAALTPGTVLRPAVVAVTTSVPSPPLFGDDITERYVGCFVTNSSGAPRPMYGRNGRYVYRLAVPILAGGSATVATALDLALAVPPHAFIADMRFSVRASAGGHYAEFDGAGGVLATVHEVLNADTRADITVHRAPGSAMTYLVSNAAAVADVACGGFTE